MECRIRTPSLSTAHLRVLTPDSAGLWGAPFESGVVLSPGQIPIQFVFIDSTGWYALLDRRDSHHAQARRAVARSAHAHGVLVTTDYVIDETATLTKSRAGAHACSRFFDVIEQTRALRIEWIEPERFDAAKRFFRKYLDHGYSFTDCTSFEIMRELGIRDALTTDAHFVEAGFVALLVRP